MLDDFKKRFKISLVITVPILVLSPLIQNFLGYSLDFPGSKYVLFALSTVIFFYGGWPFLSGMKNELADKNPGMMTLIVIMLLGHWIEMRSVMGASNALEELAKLMPDQAHKNCRWRSYRN